MYCHAINYYAARFCIAKKCSRGKENYYSSDNITLSM